MMLRRFVALLGILLLSGVFMPAWFTQGGSPAGRVWAMAYNLLLACVYVAACFFLAAGRRGLVQALKRNLPLAVLLSVCLLSALWSCDPALTLRRAAALGGTSLFGVFLALDFSLDEVLDMAAAAQVWVMILCVVSVLAAPEQGIMSGYHEGAWRGLFIHKNTMGRSMVLAALLFLADRGGGSKRLMNLLYVFLALFLLFMSSSRGAQMVMALVLLFLPMARQLGRPEFAFRTRFWIMLAGYALLFCAAVFCLERLFPLLGREPTMTGRAELWAAIFETLGNRLWLGHGFGAYWEGPGKALKYAWGLWDASHAHNGWLEACLGLGVAGLMLLASCFWSVCRNALALYRRSGRERLVWMILFLLFMFLMNGLENVTLRQNSIYWTLFCFVAVRQPVAESEASGLAGCGAHRNV